jgi:hypothetical protein
MNETSAQKQSGRKTAGAVKRKRDSALTREAILRAATFEFCRNGLGGARVEAIANRAKANMRLLYQHSNTSIPRSAPPSVSSSSTIWNPSPPCGN